MQHLAPTEDQKRLRHELADEIEDYLAGDTLSPFETGQWPTRGDDPALPAIAERLAWTPDPRVADHAAQRNRWLRALAFLRADLPYRWPDRVNWDLLTDAHRGAWGWMTLLLAAVGLLGLAAVLGPLLSVLSGPQLAVLVAPAVAILLWGATLSRRSGNLRERLAREGLDERHWPFANWDQLRRAFADQRIDPNPPTMPEF